MAIVVDQDSSTDLALQRTWLAHERTLMAWVRTATSMISFGFTIYKFFQFERNGAPALVGGVFSPRRFAIFMIAIGLVSLSLATIEHRQYTKSMREQKQFKFSLAEAVASLVALFGLAALVAAILRA